MPTNHVALSIRHLLSSSFLFSSSGEAAAAVVGAGGGWLRGMQQHHTADWVLDLVHQVCGTGATYVMCR